MGDADIEARITAFEELGNLYVTKGEYDQGLAYFREMLRNCWFIDNQKRGGSAYIHLAKSYQDLGEYELAMQQLGNALDLFQDADDKQGIAETLASIGGIHVLRGSFRDAADRYKAALQLRREVGDKGAIAQSLGSLGALRLHQGDLKTAMEHFRHALEYQKEIGDRQGVVSSYNNLAVLCVERNQIEQALHLLREALLIARQIGYRGSESIVLNNIGEVYLLSGEIPKALEHLKEAEHLAKVSGAKRTLFDVRKNLAKTALHEGEFELALKEINDALVVANQLDSELLVASGLANLGNIHAQIYLSQNDKASEKLANSFYDDALEILSEIGNEGEHGRLLLNFARLQFQRKEYKKTLKNLRKAKKIFKKIGFKDELETTIQRIEKVKLSKKSNKIKHKT